MGCLSSGGIVDDDGPYFIIQNYDDVLLYNATHHDEEDPDKPPNVVRFSFLTPVSIVRDTLYIHAQITLSLVDSRRRRLMEQEQHSDQIKHFVGMVRTDPMEAEPYQHFKEIEEHKKLNGF